MAEKKKKDPTKFTTIEIKVNELKSKDLKDEEIAKELNIPVLKVRALLRSIAKKTELWYMTKLPSFEELKAHIEGNTESLNNIKRLLDSKDTPKDVKEGLKKDLAVLTVKIGDLTFALNMGIKGFLLGARSARENTNLKEDILSEKKRTTNNGDKSE